MLTALAAVRRFGVVAMVAAIMSLVVQIAAASGRDDCASVGRHILATVHAEEDALSTDGKRDHAHDHAPCTSSCCSLACAMAVLGVAATIPLLWPVAGAPRTARAAGGEGIDPDDLSRPPKPRSS